MSVYRQCAWITVMILVGLFGVAVGERDGSHTAPRVIDNRPTRAQELAEPHSARVTTGAQIVYSEPLPLQGQWTIVTDRPSSCVFYRDAAYTAVLATIPTVGDVCTWFRR